MKILAVSGGIDSVVMLHYLRKGLDENELVVVHFDHGIRGNSSEDAAFVERLAGEYSLPFECAHANLGEDCSEAKAREMRYDFFRKIARKYDGDICVAHHRDDVIESIAINIVRGTGWRGLAPMNANGVLRPLIKWSKADIYRYATKNNLSFRQDQTNTESKYLRNRIRERIIVASEEQKERLFELYERQQLLREEIDSILSAIGDEQAFSKNLMDCSDDVSIEILRHILEKKQISLTRPQLKKCVSAIREYLPNKKISIGTNRFISVGRYSFKIMV